MGEDNLDCRSPHRQAQMEILQMRLARQMESEKWLDSSVYRQLQMQQIGGPPEPSRTRQQLLPDPPRQGSSPARVLVEQLFPKVGAVRRLPSELANTNATGASGLLRQLQSLDAQLLQWEQDLPAGWKYTTAQAHSRPSHPDCPLSFDIRYTAIGSYAICLTYWISRLHLLQGIVSLVARYPTLGTGEATHQSMLEVVGCICASVSYALGFDDIGVVVGKLRDTRLIKPLIMTRALFLAAQVPSIPSAQRGWILSVLEFIGMERGIGQAMVLRTELLRRAADPIVIIRGR